VEGASGPPENEPCIAIIMVMMVGQQQYGHPYYAGGPSQNSTLVAAMPSAS